LSGPWRLGNGPGRRDSGLCGGGDGDVDSEDLELAEVGANLAVAVSLAFVPVGAEVGEPASGLASRCQMMIRMERATAHLALLPPRRLLRRRSRSPRKVLVRAAPLAAWGAVALEVGVAPAATIQSCSSQPHMSRAIRSEPSAG